MTPINQYRMFVRALQKMEENHPAREAMLSAMDKLWYSLSNQEHARLDRYPKARKQRKQEKHS